MRRHQDPQGRSWDVIVGRESFGALLALFLPAGANPEAPRQALLEAGSPMDAETELDALSTDQLNDLLRRSEPKRMA
jgi:hypothetical protein